MKVKRRPDRPEITLSGIDEMSVAARKNTGADALRLEAVMPITQIIIRGSRIE